MGFGEAHLPSEVEAPYRGVFSSARNFASARTLFTVIDNVQAAVTRGQDTEDVFSSLRSSVMRSISNVLSVEKLGALYEVTAGSTAGKRSLQH